MLYSGHLFLCLVALQSHFVPFFIIYRKKGARGMLKERIRTDCGNSGRGIWHFPVGGAVLRLPRHPWRLWHQWDVQWDCCRGDGAWAFVRGGGVEAETDSVSSSGTESIRQSGLLHAFGSGRGLQRRFGGNRGNFTGGDRRIKGRKQSRLLPGFLLEHMQG